MTSCEHCGQECELYNQTHSCGYHQQQRRKRKEGENNEKLDANSDLMNWEWA